MLHRSVWQPAGVPGFVNWQPDLEIGGPTLLRLCHHFKVEKPQKKKMNNLKFYINQFLSDQMNFV